MAEESIRYTSPESGGFSPWGTGAPIFYLEDGTEIVDVKTWTLDPSARSVYWGLPNGSVISAHLQKLRIKHHNCCGVEVITDLPQKEFRWVKSSNDLMTLIEVQ